MKELLSVLFYQAIVAVNAAVILSAIVWLAKRNEEKDERKPPTTGNFGITEETVKELGRVMARIGVSCDTIAEALNGLADAVRKREESSVTPKPTTTGKSVVKPKKRKYDEYSALPYAVGTVQRFYKPILTSAIVQAEGGKIVIPPEEAGTPVSGYGDGKIYGYVQTLVPDDGNDDGKAYPINPRTGEVEGYPAINGTVYRVYFWTSGKAVKTVHVNPLSGREKFEAAFEALKAEPVSIFNPAEESAEAYFLEIRGGIGNKVVDTVKMCCGSCRWHDDNGLCHCEAVCNPEKLPFYGVVKRPGDHLPCKHWEIGTITDNRGKEAPVQTTHICKNCKHYLATEENAKVGFCGMKGEIAFGNSYRACFEKREGK